MQDVKSKGKFVRHFAASHHTNPRGISPNQLLEHLQHDTVLLLERKQYLYTALPKAEPAKDVSAEKRPSLEAFDDLIKAIASKLCEEHPNISIDPDMLGGMPHVAGLRLSVGSILAKLHRFGNIEKIVEIYRPDLSEAHVKEAIAYAQDFLEEMYVHGEPS